MKLFWNFVDSFAGIIALLAILIFASFGCCDSPVESDYKRSKEIHELRGDSTSIEKVRYITIPKGTEIDSAVIVIYHYEDNHGDN